jgi:hypothetical protein
LQKTPEQLSALESPGRTYGSSFMVDVVVIGVDPARPVDVYQFALAFDPHILRAVSVVSFGFLPGGIVLQSDVTPHDVKWAAGVLGAPGISGDGILATITFEANANGTSRLSLHGGHTCWSR